ncbi:MAG: ABC transporter permease [Acidobacteria bacterium]|nr:ABC transporter permease [Acidobacteriota bacterium]
MNIFAPIFRAMLRNKLSVGMMLVEISVTTAIVLVASTIIRYHKGRADIPSGIDEDHLINVKIESYGSAYTDDVVLANSWETDLQELNQIPGVIAATQIAPLPLQGGGSSSMRKPSGAGDERLVRTPNYYADWRFLQGLGLELESGRAFNPGDYLPPGVQDPPEGFQRNVIVTRALADTFFPGESALGKQISQGGDGGTPSTIVGIVKYMHTPYDEGKSGMEYRSVFTPYRYASASRTSYLVRVKPDAYSTVFNELESRLQKTNPDRIIHVSDFAETVKFGRMQNLIMVNSLSVLLFLLLFVMGLGLLGLTSFRVTGKVRQWGTLRAVGASKGQTVAYVLTENLLIVLMGLMLGSVLAYVLNGKMLAMNGGTHLSLALLGWGWGLVLLLALVASLWPALRAGRISPIQAIRM